VLLFQGKLINPTEPFPDESVRKEKSRMNGLSLSFFCWSRRWRRSCKARLKIRGIVYHEKCDKQNNVQYQVKLRPLMMCVRLPVGQARACAEVFDLLFFNVSSRKNKWMTWSPRNSIWMSDSWLNIEVGT
jgi:hypothetical protein